MKHPLFCFFCFFLWLGCCWGTDYCLLSVPNEGVITGHSGVVASKSGEVCCCYCYCLLLLLLGGCGCVSDFFGSFFGSFFFFF